MDTLRLKRPFMHGSAVRRVQEMLDGMGHSVGNVDGIYGPATEKAVMAFQNEAGDLKIDGVCGPKTWETLLQKANQLWLSAPPLEGEVIVDITGRHAPPRLAAGPRPLENITGVTIHQTGCGFPSDPAGWSRLNAHVGITQEGLLVLVNEPSMMIWHAQGLSPFTIGIEIEGNYQGIEGKKNTLWKGGGGPYHLNDKMMVAFEALFEWLQEVLGPRWKYIHAHRQSANSRIADPGEEIWKAVALPWLEKLGLSDGGLDYHLGTGRPIPREWNGNDESPRYWADAE